MKTVVFPTIFCYTEFIDLPTFDTPYCFGTISGSIRFFRHFSAGKELSWTLITNYTKYFTM